jgi:YebC/PmpR family DNA-binding regulatory protein
MSGHSKWSTIKRKKGAADAKRGKIFTKIIKEIMISVREGGPDTTGNSRLRLAIQNAKGANMPKENIDRAIKKAGGADAEAYHEITYEGYGSNGIAVFVEGLTNNTNRTLANIRFLYGKYNGALGPNGSLTFLFDRKGIFTISREDIDDKDIENIELELIDAGAENFEADDEWITVTCAKDDFGSLNRKLEHMGIEPDEAKLQRVPKETKVLDVEAARKVMRFVEALEDDDDVQAVYHNLEISDELAETLDL